MNPILTIIAFLTALSAYAADVPTLPEPSSTPFLMERVEVLSQAELYGLALEVSGSPSWASVADDVFWCESRGHVTAVGRAGEVGLAQIHPIHVRLHQRFNLFDPYENLMAAWALWQRAGWGIWSCAR